MAHARRRDRPGRGRRGGLRRELREETGLESYEPGPTTRTRRHSFPWYGRTVDQRETFVLVRVRAFEPCPDLAADRRRRRARRTLVDHSASSRRRTRPTRRATWRRSCASCSSTAHLRSSATRGVGSAHAVAPRRREARPRPRAHGRGGADALVVRAPDNVVYLTSFWGMKGYETVVFPREGEATLVTIEASADDAARSSRTRDVRFVEGYHPEDLAAAWARSVEVAAKAAAGYGRIGLELSLGTQAADRMVGEPTTYTRAYFDAFGPDVVDATPLLNRARAVKTAQEPRAHAARERDRQGGGDGARAWTAAAGDDGERGGRALERLGARARHRLPGRRRPRARLLPRLVGPRHSHVHGDRVAPGQGARADAVRDLGLRGRLLVRPHEEPRSGDADRPLRGARARVARCVPRRRRLPGAGRCLPSSTG